MFNVEKIADRKIQEAAEEGAFDNLPGKGKPLYLEDDPLTPPHLRLANHILKNAQIPPDWIQLDIHIRSSMKECRRQWQEMEREYPRRKARASADADSPEEREAAAQKFARWYMRTRDHYNSAIRQVNSDILKYNLVAPRSPTVLVPYRLDEETARFDAAFPAPPLRDFLKGEEPQSGTWEAKKSVLREAAAARYRARRAPEESE